jgi:hypothetical protein
MLAAVSADFGRFRAGSKALAPAKALRFHGASCDAGPGSREPSPFGSRPSGFDPSGGQAYDVLSCCRRRPCRRRCRRRRHRYHHHPHGHHRHGHLLVVGYDHQRRHHDDDHALLMLGTRIRSASCNAPFRFRVLRSVQHACRLQRPMRECCFDFHSAAEQIRVPHEVCGSAALAVQLPRAISSRQTPPVISLPSQQRR